MRFARVLAKLESIAASELAFLDKLRYLCDLAIARRGGKGGRRYRLRASGSLALRKNSTDFQVFDEVFIQRVYARHAKGVRAGRPVILVDLGANIGLSVAALARHLRPRAIVAVEPDPGNFQALQENLRRAGLAEKCSAIQAFAGVEAGFAELIDSGNGAWGMRMGASCAPNATALESNDAAGRRIPVVAIDEILRIAHAGAIGGAETARASHATGSGREATVVLKCDIEGAEADLFRRLGQWEELVDYIILELHTEFLSVDEFRACLGASRYHWRIGGEIPPDAVLAVIALERMEAKARVPGRRAAYP